MLWRKVLSFSAHGIRRIRTLAAKIFRELWKKLSAAPSGYLYYRHSAPVRVMHWSNVIFVTVLLMSGLNIFNAHPALYWSQSSYRGVPPILEIRGQEDKGGKLSGAIRMLGREFDTTGFLGVSRDPAGELTIRGFPSWLTIPGWQWLAMARRWHLFFAWLLVLNGIGFVAYSVVSRHLRHDLLPTRQDWLSIGRSVLDHLRFRHSTGEASKHYNVLQKFAYLGVIFFLLPMMVLMGLGMSPALDALYPGWVNIFFGRQSLRTLHFIIALAIIIFVIVHVLEVIVTGFRKNLLSMITGYYRVQGEANHES